MKGLSELSGPTGGKDPEKLVGGLGGIDERAEAIEEGAFTFGREGFADGDNFLEGRVEGGSKKEAESEFLDRLAEGCRVVIHAYSIFGKKIGRSTRGGDGPVAMLENLDPGCRDDEGRNGGNVESAHAGAPGPDDVNGFGCYIGKLRVAREGAENAGKGGYFLD